MRMTRKLLPWIMPAVLSVVSVPVLLPPQEIASAVSQVMHSAGAQVGGSLKALFGAGEE